MQTDRLVHHLAVAQEANAAAYRRLVQTSVPGECWDVLVLTAANEKQADGYRRELALRQRATGTFGAFFPLIQKAIVVADPPGRRAGSGGATFGVMQALREQLSLKPEQLRQLRILLIHSGGASQRLPMYSPVGKIFSPLPLLRPDGQIATLFDHLYITLCGLPEKLGPGMLVLAGDVFLLFDHRHVTAPKGGVSAITMRVPADLGRGHGVFVTDRGNSVVRTLQKVSVDEMKAQGATDAAGNILIDTGLLFFDADAAAKLARLAGGGSTRGVHQRFEKQIDLYEDITFALSAGMRKADYLTGGEKAMRSLLWNTLHGIGFHCMEVGGEFLHLGTTRQFRDAMTGRSSSPAAELFQQNVLALSQWSMPVGPRIYHSALLRGDGAGGTLGEGSVVEHSILGPDCRIGKDCVISQAVAIRSPLNLPDDTLFFQVPVRLKEQTHYVQVICGTSDDFKGLHGEGKCVYLNQPIQLFMARHGITAQQIWDGVPADKRTLWNARLFPATPQRDACGWAAWLAGSRKVGAATLRRWLKSPRFSMAMILESSSPADLIEHREVVAAYLQTGQIIEQIRLREALPIDQLLRQHTTAAAYAASEQMLLEFASRPTMNGQEALEQARACWVLSQIRSRPGNPLGASRQRVDEAMAMAFGRVALASELGHRALAASDKVLKLVPVGTLVEAASPVRLDLTGGWSDTPPYCYEEGGHVINVAIDLDGRSPVRASVRRVKGSKVQIESRDLGKTLIAGAGELRRRAADPHDPFSLQIIALQLTGFLSLKSVGLHITTECRVPKGSGLGTSSILAATLIAALLRAGGRQAGADELIEKTLLLEQRLSTGGGWQDQVGGIVGGIKSTLSSPGIPQRPIVEQLALSPARLDDFEKRLVVYYSGQQRLARDILRRVEGQWLAREPQVVLLKRELKASSGVMRKAILSGDWEMVAQEIARYWRIKKQLYPGSTTPAVDVLQLDLADKCLAASLAGAGGGGFGFFLCRTPEQADELRAALAEHSARPGSMAAVYDTRINRAGLQVTVSRRGGKES